MKTKFQEEAKEQEKAADQEDKDKTPETIMEEMEQEQQWKDAEAIIANMQDWEEEEIGSNNLKLDEEALDQDLALLRELDKTEQARKDSLYRRRAVKQGFKRRG